MRIPRRSLTLFLAAACLGAQAPAEDKIEVKVVKYAELGRLIQQHKGKVVVVDFWATY